TALRRFSSISPWPPWRYGCGSCIPPCLSRPSFVAPYSILSWLSFWPHPRPWPECQLSARLQMSHYTRHDGPPLARNGLHSTSILDARWGARWDPTSLCPQDSGCARMKPAALITGLTQAPKDGSSGNPSLSYETGKSSP